MKRIMAIAAALCFALPSVALAAPPDKGHPGGHKPPVTRPIINTQPTFKPSGTHKPPSFSHTRQNYRHRQLPPFDGNRYGHRRPPPNWHEPRPNHFYWRGTWYGRYHAPAYIYPRGYSYRYWRIGDFLPLLFLSSQYYFDDYAQLGLETPPPGYRWVRYGSDALLVNMRTGAVEDVVYGAFY